MQYQTTRIKKFQRCIFAALLLFPFTLHASFIESTIGTAVVNDATATFHNPAALILLKNPQIIALGSVADFRTQFIGQTIQSGTNFTQSGRSSTQTNYFLPSFYWGTPMTNKVSVGLGVISNFFNTGIEENSILRYVQSDNRINNVDFIPAVGVKLNEYFSLGAGLNFSYANFLMQPTAGFPSLNIPDSQSRNEANGTGIGGDVGLLLKLSPTTLLGFNYRSAVTYRLSGKSVFQSNPEVVSNNYNFNFWTPARSVLSISHFVTPRLGFIGTIQRIQWSIFKNANIRGIATQVGSQPAIVNASLPYHFRNTWLLTLGSLYRITPQWIVRVAGSYNQSASNSNYQISNGDSIILGVSMGYEINKNIIIDGGYAHAFIKNQNIHIITASNVVNGVNKAYLDALSLKLTINL